MIYHDKRFEVSSASYLALLMTGAVISNSMIYEFQSLSFSLHLNLKLVYPLQHKCFAYSEAL